MERHGWTLLFHDCLVDQLKNLKSAVDCAKANDPEGFEGNANVKLFRALSHLVFETIPSDPSRDEYARGKTLGSAYRHWRRAKIGRRFRLFFRYDSNAKVIVYAWVNDESTLRYSGGKSDPYAVFKKMLNRDHPPNDWEELLSASQTNWPD
jgi:toxin YhaV